jgi:hypothetical protein
VPVPVVLRPDLPPPLLECSPEPAQPRLLSDADLAHYLLDLAAAGQDCREKLDEVRELVTK